MIRQEWAKKGLLITFEGIEGCGKTSQAQALQKYLLKEGLKSLMVREPGGTKLGEGVRQTLLTSHGEGLRPYAELFLYEACRAQLVAEVMIPALADNGVVICDRFTDSTIAYQGYGRGLDTTVIPQINTLAAGGLVPNVTFLIDCPVKVGLARATERFASKQHFSDVDGIQEDRFEKESAQFHEKVRNGYLKIAEENRHRIKVIDGNREMHLIHKDICDIIKKLLLRYYDA